MNMKIYYIYIDKTILDSLYKKLLYFLRSNFKYKLANSRSLLKISGL